ncbi:tyrosine-type recombinase/integrase [Alteromonas macleodii]|uniref:tyrosine-type recombinase/integrase n=1 Tax=Alteromonas macleodii TaxID=28108 RepID=UPI0022AE83DD|nr:tyrosine-type recombinase/integrase [Alteromonas macleodii]MCZ4239643.1 tyrosine-type recombinase/integrase [Alteromonas macleodii]
MKYTKFTDGLLRQASKESFVCRDVIVPQLQFRPAKAHGKVGYFHCLYSEDGVSTSKALGEYPIVNLQEARKQARKWLVEQHAKRYKLSNVERFTNVGELLDWYQSNNAQQDLNSFRTIKNKSHRVESLLRPYLSKVGISDCSSQLLDKAWLRPLNNRFSPSTLRGAFQTLKAAFKQAHGLRYIDENPLSDLNFTMLLPASIKPKKAALAGLSLSEVIKQFQQFNAPDRFLCLLCLGFLTRNSETVMARWRDFDTEKMSWSIPVEHTKTDSALTLPLSTYSLKWLADYKRQQRRYCRSRFLFPVKQGRSSWSSSYASQRVMKASRGRFTLHDLRKYGSTYLRDSGVDYYLVERLLNHKKTNLDATYIHTTLRTPLMKVIEYWHRDINEVFKITPH